MSELLPQAAPGFDQPLELLLACHGRMQQHCDLLQRLVPHLQDKGLDDEARSAIDKVRKYFNSAAMHHHQDEEQDLFPLLQGKEELIAELLRQHKQLEALWRGLETLLTSAQIIEELDELAAQSRAFVESYQQHIDIENAEIIPLARQQLSAAQMTRLGGTMAQRRKPEN